VAWPVAATAQQHDSCVTCHLATGDARLMRPVTAFRDDVHAAHGVSCVACHGGDPQQAGMEAMDPAKGYIGIPPRQDLPQVCGRCHSDAQFMQRYNPALPVDQVSEYSTSAHGRRLKAFNDPKVATCVSCHPAHAMRPASDPTSSVYPLRVAEMCGYCHADAAYMQSYGIPTDQLQQYQESVHWRALSVRGDLAAPTCNTCHGKTGQGDGPIAVAYKPRPRNLTDRTHMSKRTDYDLYNVISQGGPAVDRAVTMPAWGAVLAPQEMWDLVAYIRQLSKQQ